MAGVPLDIILDLSSGRDERRSDYRAVPASDTGETYTDRGQLGGYSPSAEPYAPPDGVKFYAGFGATEADLRRGYSEPLITNDPAYELANYKDRYSDPMVSDVSNGDTEGMNDVYEFRQRNRQSRGLLARPRIPRDR